MPVPCRGIVSLCSINGIRLYLSAILAAILIEWTHNIEKEGSAMEQKLRSLLAEDETLLWSGRPEAFETLDKTNKQSILTGLVIKIAVVAVLLFLYIRAAGDGAGIKPGVLAVIVLIGAYAAANPFLTARRLRKNTFYALTDKRVLRAGANDSAVPYERMKNAVLRTDADGHTTLLCGPRTKNLKPHQWRSEADAAFINGPDDPEALRVVLYAVPVDKEFKALIKKYLGIG